MKVPQILSFGAGCLGVVLVAGTALGQAGHADHSVDFDPMAGMDMSGMNMGTPAMEMPAAEDPTAANSSSGMASMDMSDPNMAASMPGGFHATCTSSQCTVIFARTASGTAHVLGTTARLKRATGTTAVLLVGSEPVVLTRHHAVTLGALLVKLVKADAREVTVAFKRR